MLDDPDPNTPAPSEHPLKGRRVALAHDWLVTRRGGELVLSAITESLLAAGAIPGPIFTMFDQRRPITPAIDALGRSASPLAALPPAARRWALPLYPRAVASLSRSLRAAHERTPFDLLVSTSSAAIKNITPPPGIPHVCYCHSPARYLYDAQHDYTQGTTLKDRARALGLRRAAPSLRRWDQRGSDTVTQFIANSNFIRSRIESCYQRDSVVVHPPVRTDAFTPPADPTLRTDSLLWVGALEPYKRVDLVIETARRTNRPLTVLGDGSCRRALERDTKNDQTITIIPDANDAAVIDHMRTAHALIQPQREDFGIVAVEAQACGLPVAALRDGGALDTVIDTKTGALFDEQDPDAIERALGKLPSPERAHKDCRAHALTFSYEAFNQKLTAVLAAALED